MRVGVRDMNKVSTIMHEYTPNIAPYDDQMASLTHMVSSDIDRKSWKAWPPVSA
jgi:hypothetical protein